MEGLDFLDHGGEVFDDVGCYWNAAHQEYGTEDSLTVAARMIVTKPNRRNRRECKIRHLDGYLAIEFLVDIEVVYEILLFVKQSEVTNDEPEEAYKIWEAKEAQNEDGRSKKIRNKNYFGDVVVILRVIIRQPLVMSYNYVYFLVIEHFNLLHKFRLIQRWESIEDS